MRVVNHRAILLWGITACLLLAGPPAFAATVAMTGQVTGKSVEVRPGGKGGWLPLAPLRKLEPGDLIRCGPGGRAVVVVLATKERFQVEPGGQAEITQSGLQGARSLGGLAGPSAAVASKLAGSRTGAFAARPAPRFAPLVRGFKGWLPIATDRVQWEPVPGAESYVITLFDAQSNLMWQSEQVKGTSAAVAEGRGRWTAGRPYVWRLVAFGTSGKPLSASRWGAVTFLDPAEGAALEMEAEALKGQDREDPQNPMALLLLAELYRSRGVLDGALETLATLQARGGVDGIQQTLSEVYAELGPFVSGLAGNPQSPN